MFNMAPWLPSLELAHRGECPLSVKSAGTLRREWRPSVRYSLESATFFHIAGTLPFCLCACFPCCTVSSPSIPTLYLVFNRYRGSIAGGKSVGARSWRPPAPRLRMSEAIPLLPLCALTASTGTAVPAPRYIPVSDWTVLLWTVGEVCSKL